MVIPWALWQWILVIAALATFVVLAITAYACLTIAKQTQQIMKCQLEVVPLMRQLVGADRDRHVA